MAYAVLILDDDEDFNSLLTDIFEQADYVVTSLTDPVEAVEVFTNTDYDLVVTDYKMPDMTGAEFMKAIKKIKPEVPVVMVSGYLENDMIRELIREGVGGVFLKPLNIFSLLERTSELIEEAVKLRSSTLANPTSEEYDEDESAQTKLGFSFHSFPCKSPASSEFADRLYNLRNFKLALTLIGPRGTHYRQICGDLSDFHNDKAEQFVYFTPKFFDHDRVSSAFDQAKADGASCVTCILLDVEEMNTSQKQLAAQLPKAEGSFGDYDFDIRVVYCVSGDLDELYDAEVIDENLYILMGTAEVRVPRLRDCPSDVVVMAQHLAANVARELGLKQMPRFDREARNYIRRYKWPLNYAELSRTIRIAVEASRDGLIKIELLKAQSEDDENLGVDSQFEAMMMGLRKDIVGSVVILSGGDMSRAATFFGADSASLDAILK